jgi:hypothetical protein
MRQILAHPNHPTFVWTISSVVVAYVFCCYSIHQKGAKITHGRTVVTHVAMRDPLVLDLLPMPVVGAQCLVLEKTYRGAWLEHFARFR